MKQSAMDGVSFVVPVHNGETCVRATLEAIFAQDAGRPMEVIVVDDCSRDGSSDLLRQLAETWPLRVVPGEGRGAAAAINAGVQAARYPIIGQVDQDVVVGSHWLRLLVARLDDSDIAAAQGQYTTGPDVTRSARAMGLDLAQRYATIAGRYTNHVCTGNTVYRAAALHRVGLFDEAFGYGYDNDMSYRLQDAGYRLAFCRAALSVHHWREGFSGYLTQQYGFGYGRLDVVAKHPRRVIGDSVSAAGMMAHPLLMAIVVTGVVAALVMALTAGPWRSTFLVATALVAVLAFERLVAGVRAARRFRDRTALLFPLLHLARDLAWVAAMVVWSTRRLLGGRPKPVHSMRPRASAAMTTELVSSEPRRSSGRVLGLIPAYNEVANLASVVAEVRVCQPDLDILVIDDGSTDFTPSALPHLDVAWLRFPQRLGIGSAMRAGLRYTARMGYDAAVRIDGDGQHRPADIDRLIAPIHDGSADVVLGSRYARHGLGPEGAGVRPLHRVLGACLSALTGARVSDPTSGFYAIGPRAIRVLAEHHPTGYPEPELRLFLSRNALRLVEVPVNARSRLGGRTSLTIGRLAAAGARVLLAMIIVPLRGRVEGRL